MSAQDNEKKRDMLSCLWRVAGSLFKSSFLTGLFGILLGSFFTYYLTAKLNAEAEIRAIEMQTVIEFRSSGAELDKKMSVMIDALLDGDRFEESRRVVRASIADHSSDTFALDGLAKKDEISSYLELLAQLRRLADSTQDIHSAKEAAQIHLYLMADRNRIVESARQHIFFGNQG